MKIARSIPLLRVGVASVISSLLSCGDNLSVKANADAATALDAAMDAPEAPDAAAICDCPAAEPPLAGRFIHVTRTRVILPNENLFESAICPDGAQLISGSCTNNAGGFRKLILREAGFYDTPPSAWNCYMENADTVSLTIRVTAVCLVPPI